MSNYTKVQFISWELYTGPVNKASSGTPSRGWYDGLLSVPTGGLSTTTDLRVDVIGQCVDIEARLAFTADAIGKARALADPSDTTLKIFLAPEFLYRGAGGAYLHDLINGWQGNAPADFAIPSNIPYSKNWGGLFGGLKALAADAKNADWLFVFGTAIGASFPAKKASDTKYYLDPSQASEIYNIALVQRGGEGNGNDAYASRKQYISHIDFLDEYAKFISHIGSQVKAAEPRTVVPTDAYGDVEGGAVFNINGVNDATGKPLNFGLEVCLDHAQSGGIDPKTNKPKNNYGRIRTASQYVKIQLVPSGGMNLIAESIRLEPATGSTPHSYAFNCDGLTDVAGQHYGSHTQLWNGANGAPVTAANKLLEASSGEDTSKATTKPIVGSKIAAVTNSVKAANNTIADSALWSNGDTISGAGVVRVLDVVSL